MHCAKLLTSCWFAAIHLPLARACSINEQEIEPIVEDDRVFEDVQCMWFQNIPARAPTGHVRRFGLAILRTLRLRDLYKQKYH